MITFIETFAILEALVITITLDSSLKAIDLQHDEQVIEECYNEGTLTDIYGRQFGDTPLEAYNNASGLLIFYSVAGSAVLIFSLITIILLLISLKKTQAVKVKYWLRLTKWVLMIDIMGFVMAITFMILSIGFSVLIFGCKFTMLGTRAVDICLIFCFICVGLTFIGMFIVAFLHKQYLDPPVE